MTLEQVAFLAIGFVLGVALEKVLFALERLRAHD